MIDPAQEPRIFQALPFLRMTDLELIREFRQSAFYARIPTGKDVFVEGDAVQSIALLISGVVRVYKIGENGREITLYRFGLGESCILTANAIMNQQTFPAVRTRGQNRCVLSVQHFVDVFLPAVRPDPLMEISLRINESDSD